MPVKMDMVFKQQSLSTGWVETWYLDTTDLDGAAASGVRIARDRAALLGFGVTLEFVRVSLNIPTVTPSGVRRQRLMLLRSVQIPGSFNPSVDTADVSWQALKIRWESTSRGSFRMQELRGIVDRAFSNNTVQNLRSIYQIPLDAFRDRLIAEGAKIKHLVRGTPPTNSFIGIQSAIIEGVTRRATGRPLYLYRGRRSKSMTP